MVRLLSDPSVNSMGLSRGMDHVVLEIYCHPRDGVNYYRVEPRRGGAPGLHDSRKFEITSNSIPKFWVVDDEGSGTLCFTPEAWNVTGFWEAYFDDEEWAVQRYFRWRDEMLKELPESMQY